MRRETAALRDFNLAYVAVGSVASDRYGAGGRGMSASPPIASELWHSSDPPLRARDGRPEAKLSNRPRDTGRLTTHLGGIIMKLPSRRSPCLVAAGALSILLGLTGAWSQTARTVKIVVPYPAGGTADILARILGEQISRTEGVTLLTENRPGASAVIGTEAVSRAAPDGSTLLITSTAFLIGSTRRVPSPVP